MMMSRITNLTAMSLVIEDIGVRLQPSGGLCSVVVQASTAAASADLKRYAQWVRVDNFEIVEPRYQPRPNPPAAPPPPPPPPAMAEADKLELDMLRRSVDTMRSRQEELFDLLRMALRDRPALSVGPVPAVATTAGADPEPIVLPRIVPQSVEVSVHAKEDTLQRDDFDSALAALKKARGK